MRSDLAKGKLPFEYPLRKTLSIYTKRVVVLIGIVIANMVFLPLLILSFIAPIRYVSIFLVLLVIISVIVIVKRRIVLEEVEVDKTETKFGELVGHDLTKREIEVLALVAEGKTTKEIASQLTISPPTVKTHIRNIYSKLEVANRAEVISVAKRYVKLFVE